MANYTRGIKTQKELKCMNSDPATSKWRAWAPIGGCDEVVVVDSQVEKVLCWRCTSRTTGEPTNENYFDDVDRK